MNISCSRQIKDNALREGDVTYIEITKYEVIKNVYSLLHFHQLHLSRCTYYVGNVLQINITLVFVQIFPFRMIGLSVVRRYRATV